MTLTAIHDFLLERVPQYRDWPSGRLMEWLAHWMLHQALGVVTATDGRVLAVGVAYACDWDQLGKDWNIPQAAGPCVYVEVLVAERPELALALFPLLFQAVPDWREKFVIGRRHGKLKWIKPTWLQSWVRQLAKHYDLRCTSPGHCEGRPGDHAGADRLGAATV